MIPLEQARQRILDSIRPLPTETVPLLEALGRFCQHDLRARRASPAFDNSAVDGYAVHAADLAAATTRQPVTLRVLGCSPAGSPPATAFPAGYCHRIFTGAPLPCGADAILMQEDALPHPSDPNAITVPAPIRPWEAVRFAGEDFQVDARLLPAGTLLGPTHLSVLAAAGYDRVVVPRRTRIHALSTGSELVDPGVTPRPGQITDSNGILIEALVRGSGAELTGRARIEDRLDATLAALEVAARTADVIITTGGVSVGDADLLRPAVEQLGGTIEFWRIAMKPGKPFVFGRLGNAWWFGLPGNPVSAFVTWWQLVRPALQRLAGATEPRTRFATGRLAAPVSNHGDRRHFLRVHLDPQGFVSPVGKQGSHIQSSLALANALLDVAPGSVWSAGREVVVERVDEG